MFVSGVILAAGSSHSAKPQFNADCPGNIEVHADQGGPIYINGMVAELNAFNDGYHEATQRHLTMSIMITRNGTLSLS